MSMPDEPNAGRRSYDREIDPIIETYVEKRLTTTRHDLRGEFTVAMQAIEKTLLDIRREQAEARVTATREHAEVRADIADLRHCVAPLPDLLASVDVLEQHDTIGTTRQQDRDRMLVALRWWATAVIAAIGTATGLILAFNH
jgi:hypothetical protein